MATGAAIVFITFLAKDVVSEGIRSQRESVEIANQFYSIHNENVELWLRIDNIGEAVGALSLPRYDDEFLNSLQEIANETSRNNREAAKDFRRAYSNNERTKDLLGHINDALLILFLTDYSAKSAKRLAEMYDYDLRLLAKQVEDSKDELETAYRMFPAAGRKLTPEEARNIRNELSVALDKSRRAGIQAETLQDGVSDNNDHAVKAAESYSSLLKIEDSVCNWALFAVVIIGLVISLLSQLAGVEAERPEV